MRSSAHIHEAATATVETLLCQHRKIVDAIGKVLKMHYESSPKEQLILALDEMIECTRSSFMEAETLKLQLGDSPSGAHPDAHATILLQMEFVRQQVALSNTGRLLPSLMVIDHWLTTHISEEMLSMLHRRQGRLPENSESCH